MIQITIRPDGKVEAIHQAQAAALYRLLGHVNVERVSRVEPVNPVLRALFRALRWWVHDTSIIAGWTRLWPCRWRSRILLAGAPTLGPYRRRADAIAAEVEWLRSRGY